MKLRDLLNNYHFDRYDRMDNDDSCAVLAYNTRTVRVYPDGGIFDPFFEIGMACDCGNDDKIHVADFVKKELLDRKVDRFYVDEDLAILFVFLEDNENEGKDD